MGRISKYNNEQMATSDVYRAGIYLRLSRDDGDKMESDSISTQREIINRYLTDKKDIVVIDTYIDDGWSGTNFNRPDFRRMEQDWQAKKINCIIVKDLSRFGRDYIDVGNYMDREFPKQDIRFIAINDNYDNLQNDSCDPLIVPVKNVFNGYYAKDIQKRVNQHLDEKRRSGEFVGSFACYGYMKDPQNKHKLIIDEYPASIVRRIFKAYADGKGQLTIAKELNDDGIPCPSEYKKNKGLKYRNNKRHENTVYWTYSTVHRILINEMYIGNMVQGKSHRKIMRGKSVVKDKKDWVVVENTHPAIIDMALWNRIQKEFSVDTRQDIVEGMQNNVHVFAGLIVCADCKRAMSKNKSRNTLYYVCSTNKRYGKCSRHAIKYDVIYDIVLSDLNECIKSIKDLKVKIEKNKPIQKKNNDSVVLALKRAKSELARVEHLLKDLYEDFKSDLLTKEQYINYRNDYTIKEKALQDEIDTLEKQSKQTPENLFKHSKWVSELLQYQKITSLDRDMVMKMVDKIEVSEDNVISITYNFSSELDSILNSEYSTIK